MTLCLFDLNADEETEIYPSEENKPRLVTLINVVYNFLEFYSGLDVIENWFLHLPWLCMLLLIFVTCEHLMAQKCFVFSEIFSSLFDQILNYIAAPLQTMWQDILRNMLWS